MPGKYPTNPEIVANLLTLRTQQGLTNAQLSKWLGIEGATATFLSKYLNDSLDREVPNFELLAADILKGINARLAYTSEIFQTSVTRRMANCFNLIRSTGDIALITAPAGNGKSSGIAYYQTISPSTVAITLNATTTSGAQVESALFNAVENRTWSGRTKRFDFLVEHFKKASRLLIVDNAQRLDSTGRQWLFDFCDEANMPTALIGNPEVLDKIRRNDQQFSRIGIRAQYELEEKELPEVARHVAAQFSDIETAAEIEDLCTFIASKPGRLRAVRKSVILMQELRKASPDLADNPRKALRAAHSRLVRDYALPGD
ncbi:AAA family ATPase [Luteolibacter sp. SL250]|uniref:AAA family ATPase n=1 Tax=Luteolibacter sp. SL250 TaxID=2995170 RepID=UPI0022722635|nr:AAA family ATPase [Luteolibacter sp. SL250]WAC18855.1 AAA family ATPase [Luteolibacter sp. SL250]